MTQLFQANKELNEKEIESKSTILNSKPRLLMIVLTTRCNLRCIMCQRYTPGKGLTFPFETIKQIYSLFPYLEGINWQGGEVFLVDYFKELFLEVKKYPNICQSIITNGLLINEEWAKIIAESRINLGYSIDGVTKHTYEKIRKGAKFEDLLKSAEIVNKAIRKKKGEVNLFINAVVMRSNYKELSLFPRFCKEFGFNFLRLDFVGKELPEEDLLNQKDDDVLNYLRKVIPEIKYECSCLGIDFDYTKINLNQEKETPSSGNREEVKLDDKKDKDALKCKLPWKKLFIDISTGGSVRPGCLCNYSLGSIMDKQIGQLWNNEIMQQYRSHLAGTNIENFCSKVCLDNLVDRYELEGVA